MRSIRIWLSLLIALGAAFAVYAVRRISETAPRVTADSDVLMPLNARDPSSLVMGPGATR